MNTPAVQDEDPIAALVNRSVLLHELHKVVDAEKTITKAALAQHMSRGSKLTSHHPATKVALGTVSMSDTKPAAKVEDEEAFESWVRVHYSDQLQIRLQFGPPEEVAAVLAEHAPHLVSQVVDVPESVRKKALADAAVRDVPGTFRYTPGGTVSVRANAQAELVVRDLLAASPFPLLALAA